MMNCLSYLVAVSKRKQRRTSKSERRGQEKRARAREKERKREEMRATEGKRRGHLSMTAEKKRGDNERGEKRIKRGRKIEKKKRKKKKRKRKKRKGETEIIKGIFCCGPIPNFGQEYHGRG